MKRDKRGRVRSTAEQRQAVLEQFACSGLSGPEFARVAGVAYQTFASWRHQQRKETLALSSGSAATRGAERSSVRLMEAVMAPSLRAEATHVRTIGGVALRIELPCGASFGMTELAQVPLAAALLQALGKPC